MWPVPEPPWGEHTCAVLPEAINSARTGASFGCIGNRVYTGADDTEAYFAIPGSQLGAVEENLAVVVRGNQERREIPPSVCGEDVDGIRQTQVCGPFGGVRFSSVVQAKRGHLTGALGGRLCSFNDADAAAQESTTHENALLDSKVEERGLSRIP